jgi:hypothetical protein
MRPRSVIALLSLPALLGASCGQRVLLQEDPPPVRYELLGPPDGTAFRLGDTFDVRVRVLDGPTNMDILRLSIDCEFVQADGRPGTSFFPEVTSGHSTGPFPATLSVRVPLPATTRCNSSSPEGSRITAVSAFLTACCGPRTSWFGPGRVARYPIVN